MSAIDSHGYLSLLTTTLLDLINLLVCILEQIVADLLYAGLVVGRCRGQPSEISDQTRLILCDFTL